MENVTKTCEVCDQEIGASEKVCPKCGTDLEALAEEIKVVERAQAVVEKRRKKTEPAPEPTPVVEAPPKKKSVFRSLGGR